MKAQPAALTGTAPGDCATAVERVKDYTGLPSNFTVVSGPVDNAAAVILLDDARIPRRVIAFNPQFMRIAAEKVGDDPSGPGQHPRARDRTSPLRAHHRPRR